MLSHRKDRLIYGRWIIWRNPICHCCEVPGSFQPFNSILLKPICSIVIGVCESLSFSECFVYSQFNVSMVQWFNGKGGLEEKRRSGVAADTF